MTENKRYSLDFEECDAIWIDDNVENKSYTIRNDTIKEKELEEIVDLLNTLFNENEQLKQRITDLEDENQMMKDTILLCKETIEEDLTYKEMQDNLEMILGNVITDD